MTKPTPDTPKQPIEPKDKNRYAKAVQDGQTILTDGGSKADAARARVGKIPDQDIEQTSEAGWPISQSHEN